jgi:hypothetical protein
MLKWEFVAWIPIFGRINNGLDATITVQRAGDAVKVDARRVLTEQYKLTDQYKDTLQESGRLTSEVFTQKWDNIESSISLLTELVRDRIVGYPNEFADDRHVPFVDRETGEQKYPLKADLLPRDWQVHSNWNEDNLEEHTQERADVSKDLIGFMSTERSFFFFQGNCNHCWKWYHGTYKALQSHGTRILCRSGPSSW